MTLKIALSQAHDTDPQSQLLYDMYQAWLRRVYPEIHVVDCSLSSSHKEAVACLGQASGLILTGGPEDIHPERYGMQEAVKQCGAIDPSRDQRDFLILEAALQKRMPILGICRGMQCINILFEGTLIPDIPTTLGRSVIHKSSPPGSLHAIRIEPDSMLRKHHSSENAMVMSSHHQGVGTLGASLVATAFSQDGVIEALERDTWTNHPFLLAVQWHPERTPNDSLSQEIARSFLAACM